MDNRQTLTEQILKQLPDHLRPTLEQAMSWWWFNQRSNSGLRLTAAGTDAFDSINVEKYEFDVPPSTPAKPRHLLVLDKKLTCPYHIKIGKKPVLTLYGSKPAVMMALYGDIEKFINSLEHQ